MKFRGVLLLVLSAIASTATDIMLNQNASSTEQNDGKIPVVLYRDKGTHDSGTYAAMLEAAGCTVTVIDAKFINNDNLDDFRIMCFPGASTWDFAEALSPTGQENVRNFVRNGGGYIGIGGGADLAVERINWLGEYLNFTLLGIFRGIAKSPIAGINYPAMVQVNAVDSTHPITQSGPATYQMLYNGGPRFIPDPEANVTILGRYEVGGEPAMIAFEYGNGKVFMIGTLPQENPGPNWELMGRVVLWLTED